MNVLITGGTGALGQHIANILLEGEKHIILYDRFPRKLEIIETEKMKKAKIVKGDVLNSKKLVASIKEYDIHAIIHAAALLSDEVCNPIPVQALSINSWGTLNVLEATKFMNLKKIVLVSSGAIYGNQFPGPLSEKTPPDPVGIYGLSKQISEGMGLMYRKLYGIDFLAVRIGVVYGPGQSYMNHAGRFVKNAVAGVPIRMKTGGDHPREWLYIKDAAKGIVLALRKRPHQQIYNIGTGVLNTTFEMAEIVKSYIPDANIKIGEGRLKQVHLRGPMDITRAQHDLNYEPQYNLEKGIREFIEYEKSKLSM